VATVANRRTFAVTALDAWQRWHDDDGDPDRDRPAPTVEDLRKMLLDRQQTANMLVGIAGHKVLEGLAAGDLAAFDVRYPTTGFDYQPIDISDGPAFNFGDVPAPTDELAHGAYTLVEVEKNDGTLVEIELRWELPNDEALPAMPLLEAKVEHTFETALGPLTARGRIDGSDGVEIVDYKFSGRVGSADYFDELSRQWQWRLYLLATGASAIRYEAFQVRPPLKDESAWRVCARQTYRQFAYAGMARDLAGAVEAFARAIDQHVPEYWDRNAHLEAPVEEAE
jgi:hypothetical protein